MKNLNLSVVFGAVILIFVIVALMPDIFTEVATLESDANIPTWVSTIIGVVVAGGFVMLIWNLFGNKTMK